MVLDGPLRLIRIDHSDVFHRLGHVCRLLWVIAAGDERRLADTFEGGHSSDVSEFFLVGFEHSTDGAWTALMLGFCSTYALAEPKLRMFPLWRNLN